MVPTQNVPDLKGSTSWAHLNAGLHQILQAVVYRWQLGRESPTASVHIPALLLLAVPQFPYLLSRDDMAPVSGHGERI